MSANEAGLPLQKEEYQTELEDLLGELEAFHENLDPEGLVEGEEGWLRETVRRAADINTEIGYADLGIDIAHQLDSVQQIIDRIAADSFESSHIIDDIYYSEAEPSLEVAALG